MFCSECGRPITSGQSFVIEHGPERGRPARHANCGERDLSLPARLTARRVA